MDTVAKIQVKMIRLKEFILEKVDEGDWRGVANLAMDLREKQVELTIALELQDKAKDFTNKGDVHTRALNEFEKDDKMYSDMTNAYKPRNRE